MYVSISRTCDSSFPFAKKIFAKHGTTGVNYRPSHLIRPSLCHCHCLYLCFPSINPFWHPTVINQPWYHHFLALPPKYWRIFRYVLGACTVSVFAPRVSCICPSEYRQCMTVITAPRGGGVLAGDYYSFFLEEEEEEEEEWSREYVYLDTVIPSSPDPKSYPCSFLSIHTFLPPGGKKGLGSILHLYSNNRDNSGSARKAPHGQAAPHHHIMYVCKASNSPEIVVTLRGRSALWCKQRRKRRRRISVILYSQALDGITEITVEVSKLRDGRNSRGEGGGGPFPVP